MENNIVWIFRSYKNKQAYKKGIFFFQHLFSDFDMMKEFSARHSEALKIKYKGYISIYWKINLDKNE